MNNLFNDNSSKEPDFSKLNLTIPSYIQNMEIEKQKEIYEYLENLDTNGKIAYRIAMEHLGTSFNILRSNGFSEWKKEKNK